MPKVCGVQFRGTGKTYYFSPQDLGIERNDYVIVETSRGQELGQAVLPVQDVPQEDIVGELKPVLRKATTIDLLDAQRYRQQEDEAMAKCSEQVARFNLSMKIVGAEYNYDGSRLTFFFTAEQRVDFRQLVRELARQFKTRIELRQIGVRDEAKILGGLGKCGRNLCCATWLTDFRPVSIRMAKQQNLPLSPMEISGICGRLLCCLLYEDDYYREIKSRFPRVGRTIETPYGSGRVVRVSVLKETVSILLEDGSTLELEADELTGKPMAEGQTPDQALAARRRQKVEDALATSQTRRAAKPEAPPQQAEAEAPARPTRSSRRGRRSRSRGSRQRSSEGQGDSSGSSSSSSRDSRSSRQHEGNRGNSGGRTEERQTSSRSSRRRRRSPRKGSSGDA